MNDQHSLAGTSRTAGSRPSANTQTSDTPAPAPSDPARPGSITRRLLFSTLRMLGSLLLAAVTVLSAIYGFSLGLMPLIEKAFHLGHHSQWASAIHRISIFVLAIASYWAYVHWFEKREATELRLRPMRALFGGASGFALMAVPIAMLFALGAYQLVQLRAPSSALLGVAALIIIAATLEELTFRCVLFRIMERHWGTAVALPVHAVLFALLHLENVTHGSTRDAVTMLVSVTLGGLLWAGVFIITRNFWAAVANHAVWNFTILLSGVPLSGNEDWRAMAPLASRYAGPDWLTGGMFGPESSLPLIVWIAIMVSWLLYAAWRRGAFVKPAL